MPGASRAGTARAQPQAQSQSPPQVQSSLRRMRQLHLQLHLQLYLRHPSRPQPQRPPHVAARPAYRMHLGGVVYVPCMPACTVHVQCRSQTMHTSCACTAVHLSHPPRSVAACSHHAHTTHLPRPPGSVLLQSHLHRLPGAAADAVDLDVDVDRHGRRAQRAVHQLIDVRRAVLVPPPVVRWQAVRAVRLRLIQVRTLRRRPVRVSCASSSTAAALYGFICQHRPQPLHCAPAVGGAGEDARAVALEKSLVEGLGGE